MMMMMMMMVLMMMMMMMMMMILLNFTSILFNILFEHLREAQNAEHPSDAEGVEPDIEGRRSRKNVLLTVLNQANYKALRNAVLIIKCACIKHDLRRQDNTPCRGRLYHGRWLPAT